jgi:hypothetical protein
MTLRAEILQTQKSQKVGRYSPTKSIPIETQTKIQKVLDAHALKAAASEYDRSVCIIAVAAARKTVWDYFESTGPYVKEEMLFQRLLDLHASYYDPDGEYTSGKGIIGDLIADICAALKESDP